MELYYFGGLNHLRQISVIIPSFKSYICGTYSDATHGVCYIFSLSDWFKKGFPNITQKSWFEFISNFFRHNKNYSMLMSSNFYTTHAGSRHFSFPRKNGWSGNQPLVIYSILLKYQWLHKSFWVIFKINFHMFSNMFFFQLTRQCLKWDSFEQNLNFDELKLLQRKQCKVEETIWTYKTW